MPIPERSSAILTSQRVSGLSFDDPQIFKHRGQRLRQITNVATAAPGPLSQHTPVRLGSYGERGRNSLPAKQFFGYCNQAVWLEPEVTLEFFEGRRGAERFHADDTARCTNISLPTEGRSLLYCDACRHSWRQHAVLVLLCLVVEDVPGRHGHHP